MKKWLTAFIILVTLGMIIWGVSKPWREKRQWSSLVEKTSDAIPTSRTIKVLGDDWLGYLVLRSGDFQNRMARAGIRVQFEVEPDFDKRIRALRDGSAQFIVLTLDSYLVNGGGHDWPGSVIFVIDESFGGDAVIGKAELKNIDDINSDDIRGAFVGDSPSEFLLKAEATHFKLDKLKPRIPGMRVGTVEEASKALARGKVDFAVLWEPLVSRALKDIPGAHVLIDTKNAQGIIVDLCLASRRILSDDPQLAETFTRAYFATLHDFMNHPDKFRAVAAKDAGKSPDEADLMLAGIRFASLDENSIDWLGQTSAPKLVESVESISLILNDHGQTVNIPNADPRTFLFRQTISAVAKNDVDIPPLAARTRRPVGIYKPLSTEEWNQLTGKVRGTLLDEPITFRPGSVEIPEEFQEAVRDSVSKLAHYPTYRIIVEAHVAPSDDAAEDIALSEDRAIAVKRFLMWECNVPEERIHTVGAGGSKPPKAIDGESSAAWERRARRAKVILVGD